jgi:hypothetical protein
MAHRIADKLRRMPEVVDAQIYVGTARPFDFNGMVRHYYLRQQPWQAEIQLNLLDKGDRARSSHEMAVDARAQIAELVAGSAARYSVVEMPPGPPVLQSVVAEVHGPDPETRRVVAANLTEIFGQTESLVDVDNYMREPYDYWHFEIDYEKAQRRGISVEAINRELAMALGGYVLGDVKQRAGHEPINIVVQIPLAERSNVSRLGDILVGSPTGSSVPLRELGVFERRVEDHIIYHKDLRPVEYVVADVGGRLAAPVYGMFQVQDKLKELGCETPDGNHLCDNIYWTSAPPDDTKSAIEWAGEWTVTYETFRDMGIAFGAALILIYILVVWEFGNFRIPALIMAPIPLTLLGIIPAHALFFQMGWGGEFTATSMIGWIALAGIIVRNSILLVDFSVHQLQNGANVVDAVIGACKTRTRPILITAFALVAGSSVIFFDPIFQGMAISLASGVLVSTILTLVVIPLGCVSAAGALCEVAGVDCEQQKALPEQTNPAVEYAKAEGAQPLWVRAWALVAGVLITVFMLVQALIGWINRYRERRAQAKVSAQPEVAAAPKAPASEPAPAPAPHEPKPVVRAKYPEESPAAGKADTPAPSAAEESSTSEPESPAPAATAAPEASQPAESAAAAATDEKPVTAETKKAVVSRKAVQRTAAKKATVRKKAAKKAATKKAVVKKAASTKSSAGAKKVAKKKVVSKKGAAPRTPPPKQRDEPAGAKKTSARRGIRLKTLDNTSDDGLS